MDEETLISADYREQNRLFHEQNRAYGANGGRYAEHVYGLLAAWGPRTVLDYGCGKGGLRATIDDMVRERTTRRPRRTVAKGGRHRTKQVKMPEWRSYDPAIPGISEEPQGVFDMVVCTDVLEHVEPEFIDTTMDKLRDHTGQLALLTFALRASNKTLPDGRNTHLIVKDREWWWLKCKSRWTHVSEIPWRNSETFMAVCFA